MKVSIVTTSYNSSKTIRDTLDSILTQSYPNIELIIIDGASKDDTMDIVKSYEEKFKGKMRYVSEKDNGIYNAMNKGLKLATGDIVGILNSDDVLFDDSVIESYVKAFKENGSDAIITKTLIVDADNLDTVIAYRNVGAYEKGAFFKGWHPPHPSLYVKNDIYKKYGYFDENFKIAGDYELMLRFIEKHQIKLDFLDIYSVKLRIGGASSTIKGHIVSNIEVMKSFKVNGYRYPILCLPRKILPKIIARTKNRVLNQLKIKKRKKYE